MKTIQTFTLARPLFAVAMATFALGTSAQEFGYHGDIGPEAHEWCSLGTNYAACCQGVEQSPINIVTSSAQWDKNLSALQFRLATGTTLHVTNNGHTVQANVPAGAGTLNLEGVEFNLSQFHFHTPSEHTVDGNHAPIEMHLVHKTADGTHTAVVAAFIVPGKENKELEKIWSVLPEEEGAQASVAGFNLKKILPGKKNSYRYMGSLTTPPCSEGVFWNLLATPITMSTEQIDAFRQIFSGEDFPEGNARPTQSLQGRDVTTDGK
jgi:carbonic anhydrase